MTNKGFNSSTNEFVCLASCFKLRLMSGEEWKNGKEWRRPKSELVILLLSIQQTWRRVNGCCFCCEAKKQGQGDGDTSYQLISRVDLLKMEFHDKIGGMSKGDAGIWLERDRFAETGLRRDGICTATSGKGFRYQTSNQVKPVDPILPSLDPCVPILEIRASLLFLRKHLRVKPRKYPKSATATFFGHGPYKTKRKEH